MRLCHSSKKGVARAPSPLETPGGSIGTLSGVVTILGKRVGDQVTVPVPAGALHYEIVRIEVE